MSHLGRLSLPIGQQRTSAVPNLIANRLPRRSDGRHLIAIVAVPGQPFMWKWLRPGKAPQAFPEYREVEKQNAC